MVRFITPSGVEMASATRDQMTEIDRIAVEETGPSLAQMMENAGRSMATLTLRHLPSYDPATRILVVAGVGGNGGGGICAARHLAARFEHVRLCLTRPDELSRMAARQLEIYRHTRGRVVPLSGADDRHPNAVVIDAVLGYGLDGSPRGEADQAIRLMSGLGADILSLDVPSGVDATTGSAAGVHVVAHATLTLHMPKPGLKSSAAGDLFVADLGIPEAVTRRVGLVAPEYGADFITPLTRA